MNKKIKNDLINHIYELIKENKYEEYINLIRKDKKTRKLIREAFYMINSIHVDINGNALELHSHLREIADLYLKPLYPHNIVPDYRSEPSNPFYVYYRKMREDLVAELAELILKKAAPPNVNIGGSNVLAEDLEPTQPKKKNIFGF